MSNYMVVGNSYDGSTSFFIGTSDEYLRCTNQFSQLLKTMKVRNSKNSKSKRDDLMKEICKSVAVLLRPRIEADTQTGAGRVNALLEFVPIGHFR